LGYTWEMYSPGRHAHTPSEESREGEVQVGINGKGNSGMVKEAQLVRAAHAPGREVLYGERMTQLPDSMAPGVLHLHWLMLVEPAGEVDQAGHLAQTVPLA